MMKKLLAFLLLAVSPVLLHAGEDWTAQPIGPFGTLNTRDNSFAIPANQAQDLLNVDLTPAGKSVRKRRGFANAFTQSITTSPIHGVYDFYGSSGTDIALFFSDSRLTSSISGGNLTTVFTTGNNGATYQCTDFLGYAYCANSQRLYMVKTDGASYTNITGIVSTGTMVTACPTRLAHAGFAEAPSRIDFSGDVAPASWGTGSLGSSPCQFTINAPGSKITHITYAFGRLMWFKETSFGYILLGNQPFQTDWVIRTVAYDIGTNDNSSVYREGRLYFRGQDGHIYVFDGANYQRLSREISGTVNASQTRTSNSWNQTTQADFQASSITPAGYLNTTLTPGSVVLDTAAAISPFVDTNQSDFQAGVGTNTDATSTAGSLQIALNSTQVDYFRGGADSLQCADECSSPYYQSQSWTSTYTFVASKVTLRLKKTGGPGSYTVSLNADNSGSPGTQLLVANVSAAGVSTSVGDVQVFFTSSTPITNGTRYWVKVVPNGICDASNRVEWWGTFYVGERIGCGTINGLTSTFGAAFNFSVTGSTYSDSANFTSRSFDMGITTATWMWDWSSLTANGSIPSGTNVSYYTQSSTDAIHWDAQTLISNGGSSGGGPQSQRSRYLRYLINFAGTATQTPRIDDVTIISSTRIRPSGTLYSQVHSAANLTAWDAFIPTYQNNGGSNTFYIRAATNTFSIASSTPTWTAITSGAIPTVSTGTFFQIRDDFATITGADNPKLDDFSQGWFEGNATDKAYATYFDDKIWWSVTYSTGATTNNRILLYDLLSQGWLVYDLHANGFYVRQNKLYFGSADSGVIYKFGEIDNDNGSAINAYWKSKDFFGGDPFSNQELANISVVAKSVANSSMTVTYATNGQTEASFTMPLYNANGMFINKNKNLTAGNVAGEFNIKFGNNAADQPFEVFGIQVGVREKSWVPTP